MVWFGLVWFGDWLCRSVILPGHFAPRRWSGVTMPINGVQYARGQSRDALCQSREHCFPIVRGWRSACCELNNAVEWGRIPVLAFPAGTWWQFPISVDLVLAGLSLHRCCLSPLPSSSSAQQPSWPQRVTCFPCTPSAFGRCSFWTPCPRPSSRHRLRYYPVS